MYKFKMNEGEKVVGIQEHQDGHQTVTFVGLDGITFERDYEADSDELLQPHEKEVVVGQEGSGQLPVPKTQQQVDEEEKEGESEGEDGSDDSGGEEEEQVEQPKKAARKKTSLDKEPEPGGQGE